MRGMMTSAGMVPAVGAGTGVIAGTTVGMGLVNLAARYGTIVGVGFL